MDFQFGPISLISFFVWWRECLSLFSGKKLCRPIAANKPILRVKVILGRTAKIIYC